MIVTGNIHTHIQADLEHVCRESGLMALREDMARQKVQRRVKCMHESNLHTRTMDNTPPGYLTQSTHARTAFQGGGTTTAAPQTHYFIATQRKIIYLSNITPICDIDHFNS